MRYLGLVFTLTFMHCLTTEARQYPIFDGHHYNGLLYPRVDPIEWGKPAHMEFHIYSKASPIDIAAKVIERNNKRVLLINYHINKRNEKVCRSVVAPAHFTPDKQLYYYIDRTDGEYDNIYVSTIPKKNSNRLKTYSPKPFVPCPTGKSEVFLDKEKTSPGPHVPKRIVGSKDTPDYKASEGSTMQNARGEDMDAHKNKTHEMIDYEDNALPFLFK